MDNRFSHPLRRILDFPRRQGSLMQQQLRHVSRNPMHVVARLRKVTPREFVVGDKGKHLRVDRRPERFDRVPYERIAALLVRVEKANRKA